MADSSEFSNEIVENKNRRVIHCQFCNSLILRPNAATYMDHGYELPLMHQKQSRKPDEIEKENLRGFWSVSDMMTFENIGFSNTVENTKFLVCADCEMGPVGYHNLTTKVSFVALSRVKYFD